MVRKLRKNNKCEYKSCSKTATRIVFSRYRGEVVLVCEDHGDTVLDEASPEYQDTCNNCGCEQGAN